MPKLDQRRRRRLRTLSVGSALFMAAAMFAAACGSSAANAGATKSGAKAGGTSSGNKSALTVAIMLPFTGTEAAFGTDGVDALKLAEKYYGSTVNGHPIKMAKFTTKCSGAEAEIAWKSAAAVKPIALLGPGCSGSANAVDGTINAAGVPILNGSYLTSLSQHGYKYYFRTVPNDTRLTKLVAKFIKKKGYKRVAILHGTSAFAAGTAAALAKWMKATGSTPVANIAYTTTITTFSGQIESIKASNPDAVYFASYEPAGARACATMKRLGLTVPCLSNMTMPTTTSAKAGGAALNGGYYMDPFLPGAFPKFTSAWKKAFGFTPTVESYYLGYVPAVVILQAIKDAGSNPTPAKVNSIIHSKTFHVNLGLGTVRFQSTGNNACPTQFMATTSNAGKTFTVVDNGSVKC